MSQPTQSNAGAVVIDANILISICSQEPSEATARAALADYTARNWAFYAPSVILTEVLFALCRKLQAGIIDAAPIRKQSKISTWGFYPRLLRRPTGMPLCSFALKRFAAATVVFIPQMVFTSR